MVRSISCSRCAGVPELKTSNIFGRTIGGGSIGRTSLLPDLNDRRGGDQVTRPEMQAAARYSTFSPGQPAGSQ